MFRKLVATAVFVFLLCVSAAYNDEVCIVDRSDIISRIENRSFPSVFTAFDYNLVNNPEKIHVDEWEYLSSMLTLNDLFIGGANLGIQWRYTDTEGIKLVAVGKHPGVLQFVKEVRRDDLQLRNPNYLHFISLNYYGDHPQMYPENWPYWLRDESGNKIQDGNWGTHLIDWTHPGAQDYFVKKALVSAKCGIFDGLFMDWWSEEPEWDQEMSELYHGSKVDGIVSLVKRIREAVGDDFLILANTNTRKIPRSAPYINGAFMENISGYSHGKLKEIEDSLTWYENNFRHPQINCMEIWGDPKQPMSSSKNMKHTRTLVTLALTHSNAYISNVTGIVSPIHDHHYEIWGSHINTHASGIYHDHTHQKYWHHFFDVDLGQPIGDKLQTYKGVDGLFIREFERGWAVYNRSGSEQSIRFESHVSGKSSGFGGTTHVIPDLDGEIYIMNKTDLNNDGLVNILDLVIVANAFGDTGGVADVNSDGVVNVLDLVLVSNSF